MRIVKDAAERRNEILDVAQKMFITKGFENTSTNDILNEIGIARGTLYYHFKSKEDILSQIVERMIKDVAINAKQIIGDTKIQYLKKLNAIVKLVNLPINMNGVTIEQIHIPSNALMHQMIQYQLIKVLTPIITEWIEIGIKEGYFKTSNPQNVSEMLLVYALVMFDDLVQETDDEKLNRIMGFIKMSEDLLNDQTGKLKEAISTIFEEKQGGKI